jgi:hypothetical protein
MQCLAWSRFLEIWHLSTRLQDITQKTNLHIHSQENLKPCKS